MGVGGFFVNRRDVPCMTWLYIPPRALTPAGREACSAFRSAPAPEGSTSDLCWPSPDTVLWVMSSGTPSPRPTSWRGWKTRPWVRLLNGVWPDEGGQGNLEIPRRSLRDMRGSPDGRERAQAFSSPLWASVLLPSVQEQERPGVSPPPSRAEEGHEPAAATETEGGGDPGLRRKMRVLRGNDTGVPCPGSSEWRRIATPKDGDVAHGDAAPRDPDGVPEGVPPALPQLQSGDRLVRELPACTFLACAAAPEDSTLVSRSPNRPPGQSASSSETHTQPPFSSPGCATDASMTPQYGTTLPPSTAGHGVGRWIASLPAIRASHSASPGGAWEPTIPGTCGRTSRGSSANARPNGCSSKTSPIISTSDIARSEASWKAWASGLRKDCSRREKSARRTGVSGCSSWPTPNVGGGGNPPKILIPKGNHFVRPSGKKAHLGLDQAARMWPTPRACSGKRSSGCNRTELVRAWATPKACDGVKPSAGKRRNADLTYQAKDWTADCRPAAQSLPPSRSPIRRAREGRATGRPSRQAPTMGTDGNAISASGLTLNPPFVEALMGWPTGWTGFGSAATEWCRWSRRMRGELSALASTPREVETA